MNSYDLGMMQSCDAVLKSDGLKEFLKNKEEFNDFNTMCILYYIGLIEGKQTERKRRERTV